jgi:hypothetical protein
MKNDPGVWLKAPGGHFVQDGSLAVQAQEGWEIDRCSLIPRVDQDASGFPVIASRRF